MLNKKISLGFFVVAVLFVSGFLVSGFGIVLDYTNDRPLEIAPGEVKDINLRLQVSAKGGDRVIRVSLSEGSEIVSLIDDDLDYPVSPGDSVPVNMRVSIPKSTIEGEYIVTLDFVDVTPSEDGGMVDLGIAASQSFKIAVQESVEQPKEKGIGWLILGVVSVIVIIVAVYFLIRKRGIKVEKIRVLLLVVLFGIIFINIVSVCAVEPINVGVEIVDEGGGVSVDRAGLERVEGEVSLMSLRGDEDIVPFLLAVIIVCLAILIIFKIIVRKKKKVRKKRRKRKKRREKRKKSRKT